MAQKSKKTKTAKTSYEWVVPVEVVSFSTFPNLATTSERCEQDVLFECNGLDPTDHLHLGKGFLLTLPDMADFQLTPYAIPGGLLSLSSSILGCSRREESEKLWSAGRTLSVER